MSIDKEQYLRGKGSAWDGMDDSRLKAAYEIGDEYKTFINNAKTEREAFREIVKELERNGYKEVSHYRKNGKLSSGDKFYFTHKNLAVTAGIIGKDNLENGFKIAASHIDSPRIELKPKPFFEDSEVLYGKCFYTSGIKPYHYVSTPLAIHGTAFTRSGEKVEIVIGEDEKDPVFYISDLAVHSSAKQKEKKMSEGISGEDLNIILGTMDLTGQEEEGSIKRNILLSIYEKYGIRERDFESAQIQVVPAYKARDVGFDRSCIAAFGHDDRICAFLGMKALFDTETPEITCICMFQDKEELGSRGNSAAKSELFEYDLREIYSLVRGAYNDIEFCRVKEKSSALTADVANLMDIMDKSMYDLTNCGYLGHGVCIDRYMSSSNAEYAAALEHTFEENGVCWQTATGREKVAYGNGSVGESFWRMGMEVMNVGPGLLSMHAAYELVSKADLYMTYLAYNVFFNKYDNRH